MRWFGLCLVFWAGSVWSQTPMDRFDVSIPASDRLEIEIVPILVLEENSDLLSALSSLDLQVARMFSTVHEAMQLLGLGFSNYTLIYGDHVHFLLCDEATLYFEQTCSHGDLGTISDLSRFVVDLHDDEPPPIGTVQLNILILADRLAWSGILGVAWRWWWNEGRQHHWTTSACRAWGLHSVSVVAHELGHCFWLQHNEDDPDFGLDLMTSHYSHYGWVKESNKEIVQDHFEYPPPLDAAGTGRPQVELHY